MVRVNRSLDPAASFEKEVKTVLSRAGRAVILVPEPLSHETERKVCEIGGDGVSATCEVLSFQRIAHRILLTKGGAAEPELDDCGRVLLLARAAGEARETLEESGRRACDARFAADMLATIDELKLCKVPARALLDSDTVKLRDIGRIYDAYEAFLSRYAYDPRDRLSRAAAVCGDAFEGVHFLADGYISFTAQELQLLRAILRRCGSFTLNLYGENSREEIWTQPQETAARLRRLADETGAEFSQSRFEGSPAPERELFFEAPDVFTECRNAAKLVSSWLGEVAPSEVAVVSPAFDVYRAPLEAAFGECGIPFFSDYNVPLRGNPAVRFALASCEIAERGLNNESVVKLLKTGLYVVSGEDAHELENYLRANEPKSWNAVWTAHPLGFTTVPREDFGEDANTRLERVNDCRARIAAGVKKFRSEFRGSASRKTRALYEFFLASGVPQKIEAICEGYRGENPRKSEEFRLIWGVICRLLDTIVNVCGDAPADAFGETFALCLSREATGSIPMRLDAVSIGGSERLTRRAVKRLIILGANGENFPKHTDAPGLLSDKDRIKLESAGVSLAAKAESRASRELLDIRRVTRMPREVLVMSYSSDGGKRASRFFPQNPEKIPSGVPRERAFLSNRRPLMRPPAITRLSPSRLDTFAQCEFKYFLSYTCAVQIPRGHLPTAAASGTLIHAGLEAAARVLIDDPNAARVTVTSAAEDAFALAALRLPGRENRSARATRLIAQLRETTLRAAGDVYDEIAKSDFKPVATERRVSFNAGGVSVSGIADRVDKCGYMVKISDYKSGAKAFSFNETLAGYGLQLPLYLFAAEGVPAAAAFVPIGDKFVSADKAGDAKRRSGFFLAGIEERLERGAEKEFLPKAKRGAEPITPERMDLLRRHAENAVKRLSGKLNGGEVAANPLRVGAVNPCEYCGYAGACWYNRELEAPRTTVALSEKEFFEEIARESD